MSIIVMVNFIPHWFILCFNFKRRRDILRSYSSISIHHLDEYVWDIPPLMKHAVTPLGNLKRIYSNKPSGTFCASLVSFTSCDACNPHYAVLIFSPPSYTSDFKVLLCASCKLDVSTISRQVLSKYLCSDNNFLLFGVFSQEAF